MILSLGNTWSTILTDYLAIKIGEVNPKILFILSTHVNTL